MPFRFVAAIERRVEILGIGIGGRANHFDGTHLPRRRTIEPDAHRLRGCNGFEPRILQLAVHVAHRHAEPHVIEAGDESRRRDRGGDANNCTRHEQLGDAESAYGGESVCESSHGGQSHG